MRKLKISFLVNEDTAGSVIADLSGRVEEMDVNLSSTGIPPDAWDRAAETRAKILDVTSRLTEREHIKANGRHQPASFAVMKNVLDNLPKGEFATPDFGKKVRDAGSGTSSMYSFLSAMEKKKLVKKIGPGKYRH